MLVVKSWNARIGFIWHEKLKIPSFTGEYFYPKRTGFFLRNGAKLRMEKTKSPWL